MRKLPRTPHGDIGSEDFLKVHSFSAFNKRIRVAIEYDQRARAGWISGCEQRRCGECAVARDEDRFVASEIVKYRADAVGP